VAWAVAALAVAFAGKPSRAATAPAPDSKALAERLATGCRSLFAAAKEKDVKTVVVVTRVDPDSDPDRRLLLDAIRDALSKAAVAQGLTCNAPPEPEPESEPADSKPKPAARKPAPPQQADVKALKAAAPCDAALFATYSRSGEKRTLRLVLLDEQRSLGTASVALSRKDVEAVVDAPLSQAEVDAAQARVAEDLKRAMEPMIAAASKRALKSAAVLVVPDREGSADAERLADVVRVELQKVLPAADGEGASAGTVFDMSLDTAGEVAKGRKPGPPGPRDVKRIAAVRGPTRPPFDGLLAAVCSRRGGKSTVDLSLIDEKRTVWKGSAALDAWDLNTIPAVPLLNQKVLAFAAEKMGEQVGNGECWTLADEALKSAGARPADGYNFGRELKPGERAVPGDVMQFTSVKLAGRRGGGTYTITLGTPNHTAVIREVKGPRSYEVLHQNFGDAGKTVSKVTLDLADLTEGDVKFFRPIPFSRQGAQRNS
jgi:hypothetical protein